MDKQSLVLYFMSLLFMTTAFKIRNLIVPPMITLSSDDSIIMDCDYDVENNITDLVVKWFHDDEPIYQWIMNHPPGEMGTFRGKLDLSYKATDNEFTQYRAIKIKKPSLDLAGVYKCVVFINFNAEDSMSKRMVVINKPSQLQMYQMEPEADEDTVSVVCSAFDVYPRPELNISTSDSNEFDNVIDDSDETDDGMFNVTQIVTLKAEMLANITDFVCELSIPETDYFIEKKLTFIPGSVATDPEPESDYNNAPVSQSPYIEDNASALAPVWILLLVAVMTTLLST